MVSYVYIPFNHPLEFPVHYNFTLVYIVVMEFYKHGQVRLG